MTLIHKYKVLKGHPDYKDGMVYKMDYGPTGLYLHDKFKGDDLEYLNELGWMNKFTLTCVLLRQAFRISRRKEVDKFNKECQKQL